MVWTAIAVGVVTSVVSIGVNYGIRAATTPSTLRVKNDVTGDRASTSVDAGKYGSPLNIIYGGPDRTTCAVIWAKEIERVPVVKSETVTQSGGKGGGGGSSTTTTTTTYEYFGTFAVIYNSVESVGITKMWLNSQLFYENRPFLLGSPKDAADEAQQYFTVYTGSEIQNVDPIMLAELGAYQTPAYRDRAIIVFNRLPLDKFFNKIPQIIEVSVAQDGSGSNLGTVLAGATPLHKIVGDLCIQAGATEDELDLTELTDEVTSFRTTQEGNVQSFLRELSIVYQFSHVDTGEKLRFISHPTPVYRDEYDNNCIINENYLIRNSYHDIEGRQNYFPSSSGTSEGQFKQIIASIKAYNVTGVQAWLDLALNMAEALMILYKTLPPKTANSLYTPHWLFNVKEIVQMQSTIFHGKCTVTQQVDNTYTGSIAPGHGSYGERVLRVTKTYDNTKSFLTWRNAYSTVRGINYKIPETIVTDATGSALTWASDAFDGLTGTFVVNLTYVISCGKMLGVSENMEAWPHWRHLDPGEKDCAVDTLAWALEAFELLYNETSDDKWQDAYNATTYTIQTLYDIDDGRFWFKTIA